MVSFVLVLMERKGHSDSVDDVNEIDDVDSLLIWHLALIRILRSCQILIGIIGILLSRFDKTKPQVFFSDFIENWWIENWKFVRFHSRFGQFILTHSIWPISLQKKINRKYRKSCYFDTSFNRFPFFQFTKIHWHESRHFKNRFWPIWY